MKERLLLLIGVFLKIFLIDLYLEVTKLLTICLQDRVWGRDSRPLFLLPEKTKAKNEDLVE